MESANINSINGIMRKNKSNINIIHLDRYNNSSISAKSVINNNTAKQRNSNINRYKHKTHLFNKFINSQSLEIADINNEQLEALNVIKKRKNLYYSQNYN